MHMHEMEDSFNMLPSLKGTVKRAKTSANTNLDQTDRVKNAKSVGRPGIGFPEIKVLTLNV